MNVKKQFLKGNLAVKPETDKEASKLVDFCIENGKTDNNLFNRRIINLEYPCYGFYAHICQADNNISRFHIERCFKHGYITYKEFKKQLKVKKWKAKAGEVVLVRNRKENEWTEREFLKYDKKRKLNVCKATMRFDVNNYYIGWEYIKLIE